MSILPTKYRPFLVPMPFLNRALNRERPNDWIVAGAIIMSLATYGSGIGLLLAYLCSWWPALAIAGGSSAALGLMCAAAHSIQICDSWGYNDHWYNKGNIWFAKPSRRLQQASRDTSNSYDLRNALTEAEKKRVKVGKMRRLTRKHMLLEEEKDLVSKYASLAGADRAQVEAARAQLTHRQSEILDKLTTKQESKKFIGKAIAAKKEKKLAKRVAKSIAKNATSNQKRQAALETDRALAELAREEQAIRDAAARELETRL